MNRRMVKAKAARKWHAARERHGGGDDGWTLQVGAAH